MTNLKKQLLFVALMAIGSYTMTASDTQSISPAATKTTTTLSNQSIDNAAFAPTAKTTLPF